MAELAIRLLSTLSLLQSRSLELFHRKSEQFRNVIRRLSYNTQHSWGLILFMIQVSPKSTLLIILGRFLQGVVPSLELRIKGGFLKLVSSSNCGTLMILRCKLPWLRNHSTELNFTNSERYKSSCTIFRRR
jgi:hypothetical protein